MNLIYVLGFKKGRNWSLTVQEKFQACSFSSLLPYLNVLHGSLITTHLSVKAIFWKQRELIWQQERISHEIN